MVIKSDIEIDIYLLFNLWESFGCLRHRVYRYMLTWWKKKSNASSLNSDDPAEILLSDLVGTRLEFQVKSGKLKSPVIRTLS